MNDEIIYRYGTVVFTVTGEIETDRIESWVNRIKERSGNEAIDWHYVGGQGVVKALGNIQSVVEAIKQSVNWPEIGHFLVSNLTPEFRRFRLIRHRDITGVSGIGMVAEGVQFSDGKCVVRWMTSDGSVVVWDKGVWAALRIHGHGGATELEWID